jgi:exodeoxyribonuclease-3
VIHKQVRGNDKPSDHAPVSVDLDWPPSDDDENENESDDMQF